MRRDTIICVVIAAATIALFAPIRTHELISYDDPQYVEEPHVKAGLTSDGLGWAFTTMYFANWHPITWLSLMFDAQLYDNAPGGFHLSNILIHGVNAALVYLLLCRLTGATGTSIVIAALFAFHPLRVQSVAWAAERKGLLCAMFALLSFLAYVHFARRGSRLAYACVIACFALSLMSKPAAVTMPIVLLMLDAWPLARLQRIGWRRALLEKTPLFVLMIASCIMTFVAQRRWGAVSSSEAYPLSLRAANALWAYARYVMLTAYPRGLAIFYPYEGAIAGTRLPTLALVAAGSLIAALTGLAIVQARRGQPAVLLGWLWFLGMLVPTIGIVQVGSQSMADRYTYLPHIGLFIAIVFTFQPLLARPAWLAPLATGLAILALALVARAEIGYWKSDLTLFPRALAVTNHNYLAHNVLGYALAKRGENAAAEEHYRKSIAILPDHPEALMNLANLLGDEGRTDEAIELYNRAVRASPHNFLIRYNYGLTLARNGRERDALEEFAQAVRLQPDHAEAHYSYGLALRSQGRADEAEQQMRLAAALAEKQGAPLHSEHPSIDNHAR